MHRCCQCHGAPAAKCPSWCQQHPSPWVSKCSWESAACSTCSRCAGLAVLPQPQSMNGSAPPRIELKFNCWPLRDIVVLRSCIQHARSSRSTIVLTLGRTQWNTQWKNSSRNGVIIVSMLEQSASHPTVVTNLTQLIEWSSLVLGYPRGLVVPMYELYARPLHAALRCGLLPHGAEKRLLSPPLSAMSAFEGMNDGKKGTRPWLQSHGLGEYAIREYAKDDVQLVHFPLFVKPLKGTYGVGIRIVHNETELNSALLQKHTFANGSFLIQEAILGTSEWGVYFVAFHGSVLGAACIRFEFVAEAFVRKAGEKVAGMQEHLIRPCSEISGFPMQALEALVNRSRYNGFGCLAVKSRPRHDGTSAARPEHNPPAALIEWNTRIGGSHPGHLAEELAGHVQLYMRVAEAESSTASELRIRAAHSDPDGYSCNWAAAWEAKLGTPATSAAADVLIDQTVTVRDVMPRERAHLHEVKRRSGAVWGRSSLPTGARGKALG